MADDLQIENTNDVATDGTQAGLDADAENTDGLNTGSDDDANANSESDDKGNKENTDSDVYGSPETYDYSEAKMPDGMELDKDLISKFEPLAKKYNLSNKSANELLNLAIEMQQKNMAKFGDLASQIQENERNSYMQLLNTDDELSKMTDEEYSQYLTTANLGLKNFATDGFKKLLKDKGLSNHPEFIKTFNQVGKFCQQDTPPNISKPAGKVQDAADILYGSN